MKYSLFLVIALFLFPQGAAAHVLDEYLQTAQITLTPNAIQIELRLTPGVAVADRVFALIDLDRNGKLSITEQEAYAQRVVQDLSLGVDGQSLPLTLNELAFPSRAEMKTGDSRIQLNVSAVAASNAGEHHLTLRNNHLPELAFYQANVLVPTSNQFTITAQQRDLKQRELVVLYLVRGPSTAQVVSNVWYSWQIFVWISELLI